MRAQVQKWGNSLALRIPRSFAVESAIEQGTEVDLSLEEGRLVITPVEEPTYTLDALMAGVTPDNLHDEVDTGPPAGKEAW
jgi:antitoxin MazE